MNFYDSKLYQKDFIDECTFPFDLVVPGHSGLLGSNSGMLSTCAVASDWPDHGRCNRCGLTKIHCPFKGLKRLC